MNTIEQNKATIWQMFKAVEQKGFTMFRMEEGLIVEHWAARNDVGMARRLGLLPEAAIPAAK